jgi:phosphatidylserine/phosphatidylglycerophosphate/cardiolipin synthase-like enzyme
MSEIFGIRAGMLSSAIFLTVAITAFPSGGLTQNKASEIDSFYVGQDPIMIWSRELAAAKSSIQVATFKLSAEAAFYALKDAHQRGIQITLLLDEDESEKKSSLIRKAQKLGIPVTLWPTKQLGELHAKFTVIDRKTLIIGSFNLSRAAAGGNTEAFVVSRDSALAISASKEFDQLIKKAGASH